MNLHEIFIQYQQTADMKRYPGIPERRRRLKALKLLLQENAEALAQAVSKDFSHRCREETLFLEIMPSIKAIDYCLKYIKFWSKVRKRQVAWYLKPAKAYLFPQPLGVIGIMVPWNYPIYLMMVPLAFAIAAGNQVLIKHDELTTAVATLLDELIQACSELSPLVSIIQGDIHCAKAFAALPFNHLLFTGSTQVGKAIMEAASRSLTPVTLELGGKSAAIIAESASLALLKRLFMGKLWNAGQTCIAPDYLLVHQHHSGQLAEALEQFLLKHYPDLMHNPDYSYIISAKHEQRLNDILQDAQDKGAKIVQFGNKNENTLTFPVYLVFHVNKTMRIMQEEIFGPILPVLEYEHFAEVLNTLSSFPNPLALYYFGKNKKEIERLQLESISGALVLNDTILHLAVNDLPFGGIGQSGMGCYHGQEGFDTFSHLKPIFKQKRFSPSTWFYPPYGKLIQFFMRYFAGMR